MTRFFSSSSRTSNILKANLNVRAKSTGLSPAEASPNRAMNETACHSLHEIHGRPSPEKSDLPVASFKGRTRFPLEFRTTRCLSTCRASSRSLSFLFVRLRSDYFFLHKKRWNSFLRLIIFGGCEGGTNRLILSAEVMVTSSAETRIGEFLRQRPLKSNEKVLVNSRGCSLHEHRLCWTVVGC